MKWFKHDADAHRDAKLRKVTMKYGMEGYGLYWHCIEIIANGVETNNVTFELEHDAEVIAFDTGIHQDRVQEMMTFMVGLGLFENAGGVVTCLKLAKRLDQSMTSSPQMRKLIAEIKQNHDGVMIKSCKTRLDKTRLEKNKGRFTPPTLEEITSYCLERKNAVSPQAFLDHYETNGWVQGKGKPIKSWQACVRTWENNNPVTERNDMGAI